MGPGKHLAGGTILAGAFLMGIWHCNPPFDPFGDYVEMPFVYGIISPRDSVHFIKIYRVFRASGDAREVARNYDSIYYKPGELEGYVEEYDSLGNSTGVKFVLERIVTSNKDSGLFPYPDQVLYRFTGKIKFGYTYNLVLLIKRGNLEPLRVWARTRVPPLIKMDMDVIDGIGGGFVFKSSVDRYSNHTLSWTTSPEIGMYEVRVRFCYYDSIAGSSSVRRWIEYRSDIMEWDGSSSMRSLIKGEVFYSQVGSQVPSPSTSIVKRIPDSVFVYLWAANRDFLKYKKSLEASSSQLQSHAIFTNVNGGGGVFAARYYIEKGNIINSTTSMKELIEGKYTGHLKFCHPYSSSDPNFCFQ